MLCCTKMCTENIKNLPSKVETGYDFTSFPEYLC